MKGGMNLDKYSRSPNETFEEYKLRLCRLKDSDSLTWNLVAALCLREFDMDYSESYYRKWWTSFREGYDYAINSNVSENEVLQELESKRLRMELETKKKQTAAIEYNSVLRNEARREMLYDQIKNAIQTVNPPKFTIRQPSFGNKELVLGIADIHYGKRFESLHNKYDTNIAVQRLEQVMSETIDFCRKEDVDKIHILNNGDSIEGMSLRISQLQSLQMGFIDQTIGFQRMMAEWLNEMSKELQITYHHVPSANHSEVRPLGTSRGDFVLEDLERVIQCYLVDMLSANERIHIDEYKGDYVRFKLFDYIVYAKHGHQIKNIKTYIRDLSMLHREFIDYLFVAHFHYSNEFDVNEGTQILGMRSIMGSDEYSDTLLTGSKAGAKIYMFEDGKGKTFTKDIILN